MSIQIGYDSKTIDLKIGQNGLQKIFSQERKQNKSGSGKIEQINLYGIQEYSFDAYFQDDIYYDLIAWWSWARQGKTWSFALDSTNTANTTLDGAANSGQKVIPLTTTVGLATDDICLIRNNADDAFEVIEIDTISSGISITAKSDLKFSYISGDLFTHFDYYPSLISTDTDFNPKKSGKWWKHTFKFIEVK